MTNFVNGEKDVINRKMYPIFVLAGLLGCYYFSNFSRIILTNILLITRNGAQIKNVERS